MTLKMLQKANGKFDKMDKKCVKTGKLKEVNTRRKKLEK